MKMPKLFSQLLGGRWSGYVIGLCVPMMLGAVIVFAGCGGDEKTPEYEKGECDEGYVWSSNGCVDIDECATGTHDCAVAAICTNTPGSFSCACREGWVGDGKTCADVDECADGTAACHRQADCENTEGAYECACREGWVGDGKTCEDVDECADGTAACDENASCLNTEGAYECACNDGFEGDGKDCQDVDECADGTAACDENATCLNTEGAYECACNDGFEGDGKDCQDVDECALETHDCPEDMTCKNTEGGFNCECPPGLVEESGTCIDPAKWVAVAYLGSGLGMLDTDTMVIHGPFLKGRLGYDQIFDIAVTPDGKTAVILVGFPSVVYFVDISNVMAPTILGALPTHLYPLYPYDIAIDAKGKYALMVSEDYYTIRVIDIAAMELVDEFYSPDSCHSSVEIAADGTVITTCNDEPQVTSLTLADDGQLSLVATHDLRNYPFYGRNIAIAPDGKTVVVSGTHEPLFYGKALKPERQKEEPDPTYPLLVLEITKPGHVKIKSMLDDIPRIVQAMAFDRTGKHVYMLGNNGYVSSMHKPLPAPVLDTEMDLFMVADIESPGVVNFNPDVLVNLHRKSSDIYSGLDSLVVRDDKAWVGYANYWYEYSLDPSLVRYVTAVDLNTFEAKRVPADGMVAALARVPLTSTSVEIPEETASCQGHCLEVVAEDPPFGVGGFNRSQRCFCEPGCEVWGDCCSDYAEACSACDPNDCRADQTCLNMEDGRYECGCIPGTVEVDDTCENIDVCGAEGGEALCKPEATCVNNWIFGYLCICNDPFISDGLDGCMCDHGYREGGESGCEDIDECAEGLHDCFDDADCVNVEGGYICAGTPA